MFFHFLNLRICFVVYSTSFCFARNFGPLTISCNMSGLSTFETYKLLKISCYMRTVSTFKTPFGGIIYVFISVWTNSERPLLLDWYSLYLPEIGPIKAMRNKNTMEKWQKSVRKDTKLCWEEKASVEINHTSGWQRIEIEEEHQHRWFNYTRSSNGKPSCCNKNYVNTQPKIKGHWKKEIDPVDGSWNHAEKRAGPQKAS